MRPCEINGHETLRGLGGLLLCVLILNKPEMKRTRMNTFINPQMLNAWIFTYIYHQAIKISEHLGEYSIHGADGEV